MYIGYKRLNPTFDAQVSLNGNQIHLRGHMFFV